MAKYWVTGQATTFTTTYTGSAVPYYTLTVDDSQIGGRRGNDASLLGSSVQLSLVAAGMLVGVFLVL